MNLNEITADIRLRNPWEAIDLGFAMVQKWGKSIYIPLTLLTFSIATLLYFIFPSNKLWIAALIFWWLKPLYDRLVLHIVSRKLFNNELNTWQALQVIPHLIWNTGFFQSMTFRRFSLSRGFNLSIWQLEQLRGQERANRQSVLHQIAHTPAVWLTIVLAHLELFLVLSLFGLLMMFLPEKEANDFFVSLFSNKVDYDGWIEILDYIFYIIIVTLIHPFYIAASFALYINRRTQLEAWDIELDFRKMAMRLKAVTQQLISILLIVITILITSDNSYAEKVKPQDSSNKIDATEFLASDRKTPDSSKKVIRETMLTKELNDKQTVTYWVKKKKPDKTKQTNTTSIEKFLEPFAKIIGYIIEFGLWILVALAILLLIYFRDRWLHLFNIKKKTKIDDYQPPEIMFGMDVRPDSLPDDIIGEAKKLWQSKQHRESLSLLYRGALIRLINQENIKLENSYTEGDVLRHSKQQLTSSKQTFLDKLTTSWKLIAYAHRSPSDVDMDDLFESWTKDFAVQDQKINHE